MYRTTGLLLIVAAFALLIVPIAAVGAEDFDDVADDNIFKEDIDWLAAVGVTRGCNPPMNTKYCPDDYVTRGQMAAFMHRLANGVVTAKEADVATNADHADEADNADTLDGLDSSAFAKVSQAGEGYFSCGGTSHVPMDDSTPWTWHDSLLAGDGLFRCNLNIPNGATITWVTWTVADTDDTEAILCSVWRTNMLDYIGSEMIVAEGSLTPSWAPGKISYSDEIMSSPPIDNSQYTYFNQCDIPGNTSGMGLYGVMVTYEFKSDPAGAQRAEPGELSTIGSTDR